jgi:hypothetical protein
MARATPVSAPWMGGFMRGALMRRLVWCLRRRAIKRLELQVKQYLADHDVAAVVLALEKLQRDYQWPFQAESLLFKRDQRPLDVEQTLYLLDAMRTSDWLLGHQRFYAGIAYAYAAIRNDDQDRLKIIRPWVIEKVSLSKLCLLGDVFCRTVLRKVIEEMTLLWLQSENQIYLFWSHSTCAGSLRMCCFVVHQI